MAKMTVRSFCNSRVMKTQQSSDHRLTGLVNWGSSLCNIQIR